MTQLILESLSAWALWPPGEGPVHTLQDLLAHIKGLYLPLNRLLPRKVVCHLPVATGLEPSAHGSEAGPSPATEEPAAAPIIE